MRYTLKTFHPIRNKTVQIVFQSKGLGDTLAWIPYVEEFRLKWDCKVDCFIPLTDALPHLEPVYPSINFLAEKDYVLGRGSLGGLDFRLSFGAESVTSYKLGFSWDGRQHIPLQKTATEILGLSYKEKRAKLFYNDLGRPMKEKYVTIGVQASGPQLKYWNYPRGWDMVVRYLNHKGYKVMAVDLHEDRSRDGYINKSPDGCVKRHGKSLNETINNIRHSEFFIGLASGLSWLAWTLEKHVVMINGMSEPWHEFQDKCIHVFNTDKNVCTGCYHSDETLRLQGDWGICPEHQNTKRQFECTKTIKPPMIFSAIDNVLSDI